MNEKLVYPSHLAILILIQSLAGLVASSNPFRRNSLELNSYYANLLDILSGESWRPWNGIHNANQSYPTVRQDKSEVMPETEKRSIKLSGSPADWYLDPVTGQLVYIIKEAKRRFLG